MQYLLSRFFHNTLGICIYHQVNKAQSMVRLFLSGPICNPQSYQDQSDLPAMFQTSPPPSGNLSHGHLQSLSLLLADRAVFIGILCFRGCKRNLSRFSSSLHCCYFMDPGAHLSQAYWGYLLVNSTHLPNLEGGFAVHNMS